MQSLTTKLRTWSTTWRCWWSPLTGTPCQRPASKWFYHVLLIFILCKQKNVSLLLFEIVIAVPTSSVNNLFSSVVINPPSLRTFRFHETPQQAITKFRNFCSNFGLILPHFCLFRLIFCLFRFNRNTETRCFVIEAKQPKQKFCFG